MIKIYNRLMYEPALFVGFVSSCIALIFKLMSNQAISYDDFVLILSPLGAGVITRRHTVSSKHAHELKDQ